ncbi:MAG: outer-membrane lipoprotein carrier protein LolA [Pseudomonadota bacterium]
MISTFVSLAAIVAGAPLNLDPMPQPLPVVEQGAVEAPTPQSSAPGTAPHQASVPVIADQKKHAKPLPLVRVRDLQDTRPETEAATGTPRAEVLSEEPRIDPPSLETEGDSPFSDAPETLTLDLSAEEAAPVVESTPIADPTQVSPTEQRAILKAAAGALGSVETARGRFSQLDPTGTRADGTFALQRPGRMRFDYDDPVPILIAADGATVAVRDDELETVDRVPLAATPLNLLLDDRLDFETEAEVLRVIKANGQVAITMRDRTGESDGELTLFLDSASYDLMGWRTLDGNDRLTFVELRDVDTGIRLNPRLFIIEEFDEDEDDDRR